MTCRICVSSASTGHTFSWKLYLHFTRDPDRDILDTSRTMGWRWRVFLRGLPPFENVRS
jgi:hypothetical protein